MENEKEEAATRQMMASVEIFLNELSVDVEVFRLMNQALFVMLLDGHPQGARAFGEIRRGVLGAIAQNAPLSSDPSGSGKRQQLMLMRAEAQFQDIQNILGLAKGSPDSSKAS